MSSIESQASAWREYASVSSEPVVLDLIELAYVITVSVIQLMLFRYIRICMCRVLAKAIGIH